MIQRVEECKSSEKRGEQEGAAGDRTRVRNSSLDVTRVSAGLGRPELVSEAVLARTYPAKVQRPRRTLRHPFLLFAELRI